MPNRNSEVFSTFFTCVSFVTFLTRFSEPNESLKVMERFITLLFSQYQPPLSAGVQLSVPNFERGGSGKKWVPEGT